MAKRKRLSMAQRSEMLAAALGGGLGLQASDVDLCRALLMFTSIHTKGACLDALYRLGDKPRRRKP